ncbi:L,D-transpeptidase family protein [uncultured Bartonella sp.]|uniref:L,D-transpeptidase family protein n=1 Tax=uncultured Bartonella sp. TaxID=104108 RepID=UPI00262A5464|nr:L,D-transpeptidase family protein [uncultured Bartonella sp.]
MYEKRISRLLFLLLTGSILCSSPFCLQQALAANTLMELFARKSKAVALPETQAGSDYQTTGQQPIPLPPASLSSTAQKNQTDTVKRVVVSAAKPVVYKPDRVIDIDFSNVDFIQTNSTPASFAPIRLPLMPPYNVILEGAGSQQGEEPELAVSANFSRVNVKVEKSIAVAVTNYYAKNPRLLWSQNEEPSSKAEEIMTFLAHVDDEGLEPQDYFVQKPDESLPENERILAFTNFDVALTSRILRYIMDASNGRIIADRLSTFHDLPREEIDADSALQQLVETDDPVKELKAYLPQSDYYVALKQALADLPKEKHKDKITIARQTVIKPGENNSALPSFIALLMQHAPKNYLEKHKITLERFSGESLYNPALVDCLTDYQRLVGETADGIIGPATIAALSDNSTDAKRQKIIESMERLRWLPHNFGKRYVLINQAAFRAQYIENNIIKLDMKVVVGSPQKQTYFFYDKIRLVTFNPSWGVPQSIVINEMLPRIMQDPAYLQRNNYQLYDSSGKVLSAASVNWQQVAAKGRGIGIRQTPGKNNALGELKILFPNKHDIYLHDTPNKTAFSRDMRALSHGCVRLEYPREMAAAVLGKSVEELKPYFSKGERSLTVSEHVPVYLGYFTAWPDLKTGKINYYNDVYNRDELMISANQKIDSARNSDI